MTDPYVNGRLMLTNNCFFLDGECGSMIMMIMAYIRIRHGKICPDIAGKIIRN